MGAEIWWNQLGHMLVCTSLQTDNHASTSPLSFYRPDALPAAHQSTESMGTDMSRNSSLETMYDEGDRNLAAA